MIKVWIRRFGTKEMKFFESMEEAQAFVDEMRFDSDDPSCCGISR